MPKVSDTYERAYEACGTLAVRGINPTVKTVAEFIGTNSPAIISPAIKDWKQSIAAESMRRLAIPEVPERLVESTVALWRLAVEEAQLSLAKEKEAMAVEKAGLQAQIAQAEAACLAVQQDYAAYRERAGQEAEALRTTLAQREAESAQWQAAQEQTAKDWAQGREDNAALAATLAESQRNLERQQAEWVEKFDRDHAWHLGRISEERERAQQEAAGKMARLEETLALSRQHVASLNGYLDASAAATGELRGELKAVREEKERLLKELDTARSALADATRQRFDTELQLAEAVRQQERLQEDRLKLQQAHEASCGALAEATRRCLDIDAQLAEAQRQQACLQEEWLTLQREHAALSHLSEQPPNHRAEHGDAGQQDAP